MSSYPVTNGVITFLPPPEGYVVDFDNPQQQDALKHFLIFGILGSLAILCLLQRSFDHTGMGMTSSEKSAQIWSISIGGLCHHAWEMPIDVFEKHMLSSYIAAPAFIICNGLTKSSLLTFYLQVSPQRWFRRAIFVTITFVVLYTIIIASLLLFGCQPRETAWDPYLFASGKCIDYAVMYIIIAVANIISDIILFAIPMPMIVRLKMPLGQKIGLGIMLGIATITVTTSIIRMIYLPSLLGALDIPWIAAPANVWSFVEVNLFIICGCMPTFRKFFKRFAPKWMGSSNDSGSSEPPSNDSLHKVQRKKHTGYTQFDTCGSLELATYPDTMSSSSETAYAMESLQEQRCGTDSPPDAERQENVSQSPTDSLPPTDRGKDAYLTLMCCTMAQLPIWGYSVSFGIFQEYYSRPGSPISTASSGTIATIGALQQGVMYLMMPFAFLILTRYPRLRHLCGPLGLAVTVASLTASAFVNTIAGLIATQGALYSIGCGLLFCPISHYMNEWFVERKGMALGVMWAGKSGTGIAMPFVFDALLRRIGLKATLLAWAGASAAMTLPTLVFIKPRIPLHTQVQVQPLSFRFLRHTSFWMMQAGVIIQSLGYLMPSTYLASYASTIGLPSITGPILLALFSVASVPGGIVHGMLGDKFSATKAVTIASIGSALPIWLLWGLSLDLANLVVFVIVYGFFAGGFSSTWSNMSTDIQKDDSAADSALIFGMLMGGRGIGFVTAGPLSGALLQAKAHLSNEALGYATQYGPMIICTGVTAVFGAWAPMWKGIRVALGTCKSH
ncbi:monocarboxylate transporter 8 [Fusarium mundagurra]|uniref:Monocarboxylate transporter 8 n=1 Tax=Fusarium mundagurra TaxID=1567541 RepID=A0A8H5YEQ9_9HYPO|nr:monocarboxylate transporter 8 [Fusarium mundagurra]